MKSLSILLVDDDEIERLKFKKVCEDLKFECTVFEAKNGKVALELLEFENSIDLIISDLNMPQMNGFQFITELKNSSKFKSIPVVVMSTSRSKKDLEMCYEVGISGYFPKLKNFSEYAHKVISILEYWEKATMPTRLKN